MNIRLLSQQITTRGAKKAVAWSAGLAVVMLSLGFGVGALLLSAQSETGKQRAYPAGQLQADTQTLAAALRYLATPDTDMDWTPVATGFIANQLAFQTSGSSTTAFGFACQSNQLEVRLDLVTNRPARSS